MVIDTNCQALSKRVVRRRQQRCTLESSVLVALTLPQRDRVSSVCQSIQALCSSRPSCRALRGYCSHGDVSVRGNVAGAAVDGAEARRELHAHHYFANHYSGSARIMDDSTATSSFPCLPLDVTERDAAATRAQLHRGRLYEDPAGPVAGRPRRDAARRRRRHYRRGGGRRGDCGERREARGRGR